MSRKFKPTEEQQSIVDCAMDGDDLVINAFAGASKTTTLDLIAEEKHNQGGEVGMYLAFNRAIRLEAEKRFPQSVECKTVHSLAFGRTSPKLRAKLNNSRIFPKDLAKIHGFDSEFVYGKIPEIRRYISVNSKMSMVNQTISRYCNSADDELSMDHVVIADWMKLVEKEFDFSGVINEIFEISKKHWEAIIDPESIVPLTHDAYLKLYSLEDRQIPVSYIMIDENQDSSPVILRIIEAQKKAQKIYVGDRFQSIYGWRGAINAMDIVTGEVKYLTKSFRFGNNVEFIANLLLNHVGNEVKLHGNGSDEGKNYIYEKNVEPDAVICRTNAGVIKNVFEYSSRYPDKKIGVSCDTIEIEKFVHAYNDMLADRKVDHKLLYAFANKHELLEYCEENPEDIEVAGMVKIIEKFGVSTVLASMARCSKESNPDMVITTAHKSKGLEFDNVIMYSDFLYDVDDPEDIKIESEELNLIYVACTRAKKNLCLSGIHGLVLALAKSQGVELKLEDISEEKLNFIDEVLRQGRLREDKFTDRGKLFSEVESFCKKNSDWVKMDVGDGVLVPVDANLFVGGGTEETFGKFIDMHSKHALDGIEDF